jgi:hypothetical protein
LDPVDGGLRFLLIGARLTRGLVILIDGFVVLKYPR